MNQLKIISFEGQLVTDSREVADEELPSISDQLQAVDRTILRSFKNADCLDEHLKILDGLYLGVLKDYPFIKQAISQTVMHNFLSTRDTEFDMHKLFKNNISRLFDSSYELVKRKNDPKHIPDFWLKKDGQFIPVEIKLNNFTAKSLKQLQRYMSFYNCNNGIAVARKLTCDLPKNIRFISFSDLEVEEK